MITLPCPCGAQVPLPVDDSSPTCPQCKQTLVIRWFYGKGNPESKSYLNCFAVWRLSLIRSGRVARSAERTT